MAGCPHPACGPVCLCSTDKLPLKFLLEKINFECEKELKQK